MTTPSVDLAGDVVGPGVRRIAEAAGLPYQITRGMIDAGHLPAFQVGSRWFARRSEMARVLTAERPKPEPEPAPAPRRRRRFAVTEGRAAR
jgi:hypothetical protein